jgi:AcrR family transcriptional regulator
MAGDERDRIFAATVDLVSERGYEGVTADDIAERAGVGRAGFERCFASREQLYLVLFEKLSGEFEEDVLAAFRSHDAWRDSLRACAYAAARWLRDHPREVDFGVVQMFAAGDLAQVHRERQLQRMVDLIDLGRQELDDPDSMSRGVAEGVIGSIYGLLVKEMQSGEGVAAGEGYVPEMMYMAVRPYLGHEVAREELSIPPPPEGS